MSNRRISITRVTFYDAESGDFCSCDRGFWKTCPMRVAQDLPCAECIISLTPISRCHKEQASDVVRSIDQALATLSDGLRFLEGKYKI